MNSFMLWALLIINTITDLRSRRIYVVVNLVFAVIGILLLIFGNKPDWISAFCGILVGGYVLLFSFLSKGAVGVGDGIVVMTVGIFLGGVRNTMVLMSAFLLCAIYGGINMCLKRMHRKSELPFVPFFSAAYVLLLSGGAI